ncbi:peptidase S8/S53 subtilisin kexin sedolisin [Micromonospora globispora]|uniref:Peptidase S8/S53 subtilisin kexin sedolisin n=1 Tax=Micromonospora globispora TaxID=1450148 RepID=A0A317JYC5_9ACTN|nr:S8 family peptidase [Micromonospora globispora]PWU45024.1 peptidase S8/S53 subtilisin kexin sedolisin [Micromonospora globispora]RQW97600.1 peptidase S8/S53 subtilisin kexin sedolisin [Micromonospora globispora]
MALPHRSVLVGVAALTMLAAASPALAAEPTGAIRDAGGATAVADSYIVVLKDSAVAPSQVGDTAQRLTARHGGTVARTWQAALRGFEVRVGAQAAARIAADPTVAYVEQNHTVSISGTQTNPPSWGLDRIDQRNLPLDSSYTYPNTASNVHAYIIDTGIRTTHTDFGGRATWGTNTVDTNNTDCNGHGTHVSGTVGGSSYGVAKGVQLVAVKVLNCQGSGTTAGVVSGVDWVTQNAVKPAVANMSLGGGVDTTLDTAVRNSISSGVTYGLAAGNDSGADACNTSPARTAEAITVGSTTNTDARSSFSNIGTCLDIFAPGSSITSAWNSSDTASNTISGTSMATPHVVGAAALVASANPSWTPQQVRDYLVNNATSGVVTNAGTGSPNKLLYVVNGSTPPPTNDFSVSVSPTSGSTAPGGSVTATVSTATTSGSAQSVSLSASGLPSGATASFNPATVTSGGSSTLTITTSTSTPAGTYAVTISGTAASGTKTATYSLTVTGTGGCTGGGQKLVNPGFESGNTGWTATSGVIGQYGSSGEPPRSGTWNAWLDGYGSSHTDTLAQSVSLPAGCSSYSLSFWLHIDTSETTTSTAYDTLKVQVLNSSGSVLATLATYSNLNKNTGYAQRSFNLGAYAGQTVQIKFTGVEDWSLQTSFVIDDTALNVS